MSNDTSTKTKALPSAHVSAQTEFVEASIREGFALADVQVWQALCKKLATLSDDADLAMICLLGIADEHGISPVQLCAYARAEGYKTIEAEACQYLCEMYGCEHAAERDEECAESTQKDIQEDEDSGECGVATDEEVNKFISSVGKPKKRLIAFPDDGDW